MLQIRFYPAIWTEHAALNEKIQAHLVSVWRESTGFFSIGGREGMLILTDRRLAFVQKTQAQSAWWHAIRRRQAIGFMKSRHTMIRHDGYDEFKFHKDLENPKNMTLDFGDILEIYHEEKEWGSVLYMKYAKDGKVEKYQYSIAQDWVKYPAKDALKFMKVDWRPFVEYIKERRGW